MNTENIQQPALLPQHTQLDQALTELRAHYSLSATKTTLDLRERIIRAFVQYGDISEVGDITIQKLSDYLIHMRQVLNRKGSYIGVCRVHIRTFIRFCCRRGWLNKMEFDWDLLPRISRSRKEKYPISEREHRAILGACREFKPFWSSACIIAWHTGLRCSDVAFLKWEYVDWEKLSVRLIPHKVRRLGKEIEIPLADELVDVLRLLKQSAVNAYVLPEMQARYMLRRQELVQGFSKIVKKAGLDPKFTFHCYRHGFITRLVNAGVPHLLICAMTGLSLKQLEEYTHPSYEAKRAALLSAKESLDVPLRLMEVAT